MSIRRYLLWCVLFGLPALALSRMLDAIAGTELFYPCLAIVVFAICPLGIVSFLAIHVTLEELFPVWRSEPIQTKEELMQPAALNEFEILERSTNFDIDSQYAYAVLGVPRDADSQAVRQAFRRRARSFHPDSVEQGEIQQEQARTDFAKLNAAYEILADPEKRRVYDEIVRRHGEGFPRLLTVYEQIRDGVVPIAPDGPSSTPLYGDTPDGHWAADSEPPDQDEMRDDATCPLCGHYYVPAPNADSARYCSQCGEELPRE